MSGKGAKLIKGEVTEERFRKISGPEGEMSTIMKEWKEKQDALAEEGLDSKTVVNLAADRQRNNDLTFLKTKGGPFTTAADVDAYMVGDNSDLEKNKRLYMEVS